MQSSLKTVFENIPKNATKIKLSEGFSTFPNELFSYKDTLEILDLSNNSLSELPENFNKFEKLKIAFFSENNFVVFPEILAKCPSLTMIGFKSNQIEIIPENAFPEKLQWLILTDNKIKNLPESIGNCTKLQKCALAGNQLNILPDSMRNCINLELLRISANKLTEVPTWLIQLPRLSWLALDGNPIMSKREFNDDSLQSVVFNDLIINDKIGEGASGFIYKADWQNKNKPVAIKIFKGNVTSDGYPKDELANCLLVGRHPNIVPLIGPFVQHPENKDGIVMDFIPDSYATLGLPPTFHTCTRDVFVDNLKLNGELMLKIALSIAKGALHLHQKGVMHGDLYAHNILFHNQTGHAFLGDFGASTNYELNSSLGAYFERLDVRAFGCLLDDLLSLKSELSCESILLTELRDACWNTKVLERPSFDQIIQKLI